MPTPLTRVVVVRSVVQTQCRCGVSGSRRSRIRSLRSRPYLPVGSPADRGSPRSTSQWCRSCSVLIACRSSACSRSSRCRRQIPCSAVEQHGSFLSGPASARAPPPRRRACNTGSRRAARKGEIRPTLLLRAHRAQQCRLSTATRRHCPREPALGVTGSSAAVTSGWFKAPGESLLRNGST